MAIGMLPSYEMAVSIFFYLLFFTIAKRSPSVGFLPTGRNKLEGRVMVDYGNGTKLPVCSQGVTQKVADMLCSMIGHSGATKIYSRAKCFDDSDKYDGSMVSLTTTCDNLTDIASCFRLADCECCLVNQLGLRCYGENTIELENNNDKNVNGNNDVVTEGLVTVYTNDSFWTINGLSVGSSIRCYICPSIGLVNDEHCNISLSHDHHLRYGNISIPRVAPFTWNCPSPGSGTLENCSRTELSRMSRYPMLLTKKCQMPADKLLPNYTLCYDHKATGEIHTSRSAGKKCEMHCLNQISSTASSGRLTVSSLPSQQGQRSAQKQMKYTLPIGVLIVVAAATFAFVWKKRRNRTPATIDLDEGNAML